MSRLDDYLDGELPAEDARTVRAHLEGCASCRAQAEGRRALLAATASLPREIAPTRDLWTELRSDLRRLEPAPAPRHDSVVLRWFVPLAVAASVAFLVTWADRSHAPHPSGPGWLVAAVTGKPRVNARAVEREAQIRLGQLLETDETSRARVTVGEIGEVTLESNSRLRLVGMAADNHRFNLQRGTMLASIWAPPRLFFVDTPSGTAVDLGCQYTLTVDKNGDSELHVLTGYVALEDGPHEAIVPMGFKCITRRQRGPGTPFAVNASDTFRAALLRFDFERGAATAILPELLALARTDDSITLWHLLSRTDQAQRGQIYDKLAQLAPPPAGVTRAGIVAGDDAMRGAWGADLGIGSFAYRPKP